MLQRLLTLPSQLLEDNDAAATASEETLATVATDDSREQGECPLPPTVKEEEEDEEEVEEEEGDEEGEKGRKVDELMTSGQVDTGRCRFHVKRNV